VSRSYQVSSSSDHCMLGEPDGDRVEAGAQKRKMKVAAQRLASCWRGYPNYRQQRQKPRKGRRSKMMVDKIVKVSSRLVTDHFVGFVQDLIRLSQLAK
jgi:hypothetical protein